MNSFCSEKIDFSLEEICMKDLAALTTDLFIHVNNLIDVLLSS